MEELYGRKVLHYFEKDAFGHLFNVAVIMSKSGLYYETHILNEFYQQNNLNTCEMEDHIDDVQNPNEYFDKAYMITRLSEFLLWHIFSTNVNVLSFTVNVWGLDNE